MGLKLAILISGRGSNMSALIEACAKPDFPATISLVLSNIPDAPGLQKASGAGLATEIVPHKDYPNREAFERAMLSVIARYDVDLICLAGFMRLLSPLFVEAWEGRLINIHPSLLPDYKGLHTHQRALDDGRSEAGCSVHYVIPAMDEGPVILQKRVPILAHDTAQTLAERVLEQEHIAYPEAVRLIAEGKVTYPCERVLD
jgi:phosphoribosylglycinamide formyltransferase-1